MKNFRALLLIPAFAVGLACSQAPKKMDVSPAQERPMATQERQSASTADTTWADLKEGHSRFKAGAPLSHNFSQEIKTTANGQYPRAVVLSCIDSRSPAEMIFDQGIGDIFNVRIAGNTVNEDVLGSMEYTTQVAGAKLIVVLGHTSCGALKGAADQVKLGNLTHLLKRFEAPVASTLKHQGGKRSSKDHAFIDALTIENVQYVRAQIIEKSAVIKKLVDEGKVKIVGGVYQVDSGEVTWL